MRIITTLMVSLLLLACSKAPVFDSAARQDTLTGWELLIAPQQRSSLVALMQREKIEAKEHDEFSTVSFSQSVGNQHALINSELLGDYVSIGGFVVPLEWDDDVVTEFLLVPYFGACIHTPPPPANQMIHVRYQEGIPNILLRNAVIISGKLARSEASFGDGWDVSYRMQDPDVSPY